MVQSADYPSAFPDRGNCPPSPTANFVGKVKAVGRSFSFRPRNLACLFRGPGELFAKLGHDLAFSVEAGGDSVHMA